MENDALINELHAVTMNPMQAPDLQYFKRYNISEDSFLKIKQINDVVTEQAMELNRLNGPLSDKQMQIQLQQMDEMVNSLKETFIVISKLKVSLQDTLKESKTSQGITKWMYIISFCLGLALIVSAVVFAVMDRPILAIAFGTFGMVDIVAHFIADPPARLQESRSNYVQLTGLTLAWFKETINNDGCLANLKMFTPEVLQNYNSLSESYVANTGKFFKMMEDLAEPQNKKKEKDQAAPEEKK